MSIAVETLQPRRIGRNWPASLLVISILALGTLVRLQQWMHFRSLWLDEIYLASNLTGRGLGDLLFKPLDYWQFAPPAFLAIERISICFFGTGERSLRLPSLLFGLISLPLFYALARRTAGNGAAIFAALLAFLWPPIYFSGEVKPYSADLAATLGVILVARSFVDKQTIQFALVTGIVGIFAALLSYPATFILAGCGFVFLMGMIRRTLDRKLAAVVLLLWLLGIVAAQVCFVTPLHNPVIHAALVKYWSDRGGFPPANVLGAIIWPFLRVRALCIEPGAMYLWHPDAALIALIVGLVAGLIAWHKDKHESELKRSVWILLLAPLPFMLIAASLREYPLADRLVQFYVPVLLLVMATGMAALWRLGFLGIAASVGLGAALLAPILIWSMSNLATPQGREESLPAYQWIAENWHAGDEVYLSHYAEPSFLYYRSRVPWPSEVFKEGTVITQGNFENDLSGIGSDVRRFEGHRVWVVLIHADQDGSQAATLAAMDVIGVERIELKRTFTGAMVVYYDRIDPR